MAKQVTKDINGVKIPVVSNNRCYVEFERLTGHSSSFVNGLEDALALLYCGLKSGARENGLKFKMDFEEFIDYTDQHPEIMDGFDEKEEDEEGKKQTPEEHPAKP